MAQGCTQTVFFAERGQSAAICIRSFRIKMYLLILINVAKENDGCLG